ncbi:MAG: TIGR02281 family clan AA aspartic protease [Sphingomonas sp.]|uniref:retropepsin-like aspartic protease family protein n=1 Tax=Sphingomonas sp. TaxID=28214 RepID=UPI0017BF9A16|nr:TIGR02281 family clan AA aspartic protease [Sphingomonas sp.]MBA3668100.1 TIGR02281 family clan AA aspartic protease [Sphingomonas sp.]
MVVVIGTVIGAMMPSGSRSSPSNPDNAKIIDVDSDRSLSIENQSSQDGEVRLHRFYDGHFYADASVNGAPVRFLVDTGATGIALTQSDAQRASIALTPGMSEVIGRGAGGELTGEMIRLETVTLGHKEARDMTGVVIDGAEQSLLGQAFLSKFDSVEIHGDEMVLR